MSKNKHGSGVDPKGSAEERVAADDTEQVGVAPCSECAPYREGGELPRSGGMTEPSDRSDAERPQAECESVAASQGDGDLSEAAEHVDDSMRECDVCLDECESASGEEASGGGMAECGFCADASGGTRVAAVRKRHRKRRKLVILAASVALIAAILSVLFFACNAKEGVETRQPKDSVSICLQPPTDGSTPDDHTALDNLGYIIGRLMERDLYHTDSSSVVTANAFGVEVRQDVTGGKDYKDGIMIATTFSSSDSSFAPAPVALQKFFGKDKAVIRNSVSSDPETWAGKDTEWSDGEPSEVVEKSAYTDRYGLWATEFSDYVFTEETVLSATVTPPYDGNYVMELALDPATSTYYYAKQMVTMGGLSSAPTFSYVNVTIAFTADWTITEMRVSEKYTSSKGPLNASTQGETVIKYSYDEASVDVSAYETYFSGYADAAPSISESVKTASDYLAEGFGGVLVSDRTAFDITATIAGRTIAGRALLCMDGGSPTSVRLEFGQLSVFADLNGGNVYISVGDAVGYFALADIQSLFGGSSDILGELGGSSDILGELIGGATLVETDGGAIVTMTLPVAGGLPVEFTFSDESGNIEWTEISLSLDAFGTDISLSVTPGSADAEFGETDTLGAVYLTPAFSSVVEMIESGVRLDLGYEGDGFALRGSVTIDVAAGAFSGEAVLEISGKTPVTATFAYSDGELYLAAGGIKVRADAGEWADALLGLLSSDTSGAMPDIGETAGALIEKADVSVILERAAQYRADKKKYTAASWAEFDPVLLETEEALGGEDVSKEDYTAIAEKFEAAEAKLVTAGDPAALAALIGTEVGDASQYTATSRFAYETALAQAAAVANGQYAQEEIDAAREALRAAIDGLEKAGDKTQLTALVGQAKQEAAVGQALADAINAAQEVLNDADASEDDVNAAYAALNEALENNEGGSSGDAGGCGGFAGVSVLAAAIICLAAAVVLLAKKKAGR